MDRAPNFDPNRPDRVGKDVDITGRLQPHGGNLLTFRIGQLQ